ncbi:MAG: queuosine precursor transporter [Alphaproteobacteria bacterium]|nr:queuosine precursor transporter [Alphaproteobacteria bacterium]
MATVEHLLFFLNALNPWWIFGVHVVFCGFLILLFMRIWGILGLYLYGALATIASNIAVLKLVQFPLYDKPIALGTVLFMSLFLCNDIVNEYYSKREAIRLIWVGFIAYFVFSLFMWGVMTYTPFEGSIEVQNALKILFIPAPALFCASLLAYFISQYTDLFLYRFIRRITGERLLWVRSVVSTIFGAFLDNTIFSILLWYVFMPYTKGLEEIFWTYVIGVFLMRVLLSFINTIFMYTSKKVFSHALS